MVQMGRSMNGTRTSGQAVGFYTCNLWKLQFVLAEGDPESITSGDGFFFFFFFC